MNSEMPYYRRLLNEHLTRRIERNPKYSLRAFASALGLESSTLSQLLLGKRFLSQERAREILDSLGASPEEQTQFIISMLRARSDSGRRRMSRSQKDWMLDFEQKSSDQSRDLSIEVFKTISDWYHYAILELTRNEDFNSDPEWISKRLKISLPECKGAVERLLALELLEIKAGKLIKSRQFVEVSDRHLTAPALKKRQKQIIDKSLFSLENHEITIRNHSARTFPVHPNKLTEAKKRIEIFMAELCAELSSGQTSEVYELSIQLFPLT